MPGGRVKDPRNEARVSSVCLVMDVTVPHLHPFGRSRSDFELFYAERRDEVYRTLAVSLRNAELAREATDEAMARAYSRWGKVSRLTNPSGWVYRVAYNWALDRLRRAVPPVERHAPLGSDDPLPRPDLERALDSLSVDQRAVVVLRVVHDWSEDDVAYALGVPVGTVKSRLSRALQTLRTEVKDD
jgi:DNA-directed RNA polymerase specialized sigma24 family protein